MSRLLPLLALAILACTPARSDTAPPTATPRGADGSVAATPAADAGIDAPLALEDDFATLARRSAELIDALADALSVTPIDCAAFAERVTAIMAEHRDVRVASAAAVDRGNGRALDRALEAHADRIKAAAERMQPALTKCGDDPAFAAALTPFDVP